VFEFAHASSYASAIRLEPAGVAHSAKFNGVPVDAPELCDLLVGGSERKQADFMKEINDIRIAEHRDVPYDFVADVGLFGVVAGGRVADILGRAEHAVAEGVKKIALAEYAVNRFDAEVGGAHGVLVEVAHLRSPVTDVHDALQALDLILEYWTHDLFVQAAHLLVAVLPGFMLDGCVVNERDCITEAMLFGSLSDPVPTLPVLWVGELRRVLSTVVVRFHQILSDEVEAPQCGRVPVNLQDWSGVESGLVL